MLSHKTKTAFAASAGIDLSRLSRYLNGGHDTSIDTVTRILESNGFKLHIEIQPLPSPAKG